jgi:AAA domain-containing protein
LTLLLGEGGAAKTWLALDLALASSQGLPWLESPAIGESAILYIDEDGQLAETRRRISLLTAGRSIEPTSLNRFGHVSPRGLQIDNPRDYEAIVETSCTLQAGLIIIDALVAIHSQDENSNPAMKAIMRGHIRRLMRDTGAGVLLLHHLAKPSETNWSSFLHRARGAAEVINSCDVALGLSAHSGFSRLEVCRSRFIPQLEWPEPLKITLEDTDTSTRVVTHASTKIDDACALILKHNLDSMTVREIQARLAALGHLLSRGTVHAAKQALVNR